MNPQDALNLLDQAVSQISTTRKDHVLLQQAIEVLREEIKVKEEKKVL
jgi:cell division septum initiation protein DivIVA